MSRFPFPRAGIHPHNLIAVSPVWIAPLLLLLTSCLVTHDSHKTVSGKDVAETTFAQIQLGDTTVDWVKATLGEPTKKTHADDHEVWEYRYTERTDTSGSVFLLFGGHNSNESTRKAFVEFKDGVVVKKWRA